jgi:hypothetical protein
VTTVEMADYRVYGLWEGSARTCDGPHPPGNDTFWAWSVARNSSEVNGSGRCRDGHPVSSLAETVARRLTAAGISPCDPGMDRWRAQNAKATAGLAASSATTPLAA